MHSLTRCHLENHPISLIRLRLGALLALLCWTAAGQGAAFKVSDGDSVVGEVQVITAKHKDTLLGIAEEFELGYEELVASNPDLDSWLPGEGNRVVLPSRFILPREISRGIYINLAEYRLYYFSEKEKNTVLTFPISIGRGDWDTPVGRTHVIHKLVRPAWYPPESIRAEHAAEGDPLPKIVPPGRDNPLGKYALQLDLPGYLIHGTNRPYGIGMRATHGCIRLRPANIEVLFRQVAVETPVQIVYRPFKAGVHNGTIYFEAHPEKSESEAILGREFTPGELRQQNMHRAAALTATVRDVLKLADQNGVEVDWLALAKTVEESLGIPLPVNTGSIGDDAQVATAPRRSTPGAVQSEPYLF